MSKLIPLAIAASLGGALPAATAQSLKIGDPAPPLQVGEFVKGETVRGFEPGKTYVVEFWATWCGPCRVSIPHLTELQRRYKDVTFLGVSIWEDEPGEVGPFVARMGDQMGYRVATDAVPEGGEPNEGAMSRRWMDAAGEKGIPSAFLVNGDGKVAWIGQPLALDKPLEQVAAGTYDLKAAIAEREAAQAREKRLEELEAKLAKAGEAGDVEGMIAAFDQAIAADPALEVAIGPDKFEALLSRGDAAARALDYARRLVATVLKDDADGLNDIAWAIVDPDADRDPTPQLIELALAAARRADELEEGKSPFVADTLAKALHDSGDPIQALATQERALRLARDKPLDGDEGMLERLEMYRRAVKKATK